MTSASADMEFVNRHLYCNCGVLRAKYNGQLGIHNKQSKEQYKISHSFYTLKGRRNLLHNDLPNLSRRVGLY